MAEAALAGMVLCRLAGGWLCVASLTWPPPPSGQVSTFFTHKMASQSASRGTSHTGLAAAAASHQALVTASCHSGLLERYGFG
jgi:hypothetical protein